MTLDEFIIRHSLHEIYLWDNSVPVDLLPWDEHSEDELQFYTNDARTIGLGVNKTRDMIRVVYAELGLADSGWIPHADAAEISSLD